MSSTNEVLGITNFYCFARTFESWLLSLLYLLCGIYVRCPHYPLGMLWWLMLPMHLFGPHNNSCLNFCSQNPDEPYTVYLLLFHNLHFSENPFCHLLLLSKNLYYLLASPPDLAPVFFLHLPANFSPYYFYFWVLHQGNLLSNLYVCHYQYYYYFLFLFFLLQ